ncbi:hypothetical protein NC653_029909 [Populus alba x Populus x berolinensis]|uniref:Uncharacterized protein n=1 Tax=Populus alba x Populus x berolinensis TaxID=444605 RepID=A0AAD6Q524_9ROSI|nr:hypothetical protein NC653_029909 [Populus alba x Populus x berolinensis]
MDFTNGMDYNHTSMVYHDTWSLGVLEAATKVVKDEEEIKQKCEDLNHLVQESSNSQFSRIKKLKRRLEALNPSRASVSSSYDNKWAKKRHLIQKLLKVCTCGHPWDGKPMGPAPNNPAQDASIPFSTETGAGVAENARRHANGGNVQVMNEQNQQPNVEVEGRGKKKVHFQGRGRRIGAVPKGGGFAQPGWTVAGFDVDGRS